MASERSWVDAPGWPGSPARWTSSAKTGVGTAISRASRVWFTLSHGILNEVYYPRIDQACIRDCGLIVTAGDSFCSEEKRHTHSEIVSPSDGVPAYQLRNTCQHGRYQIEKDVIADPQRDTVLQRIRFVPLQGRLSDYRLYVLLAPHLGNRGNENTAWVGDYKGVPMLFAERAGIALALACSSPWGKRSVGFVGVSDGWQDLTAHQQLRWTYSRAENGNVAVTGEIDVQADETFVLALSFGQNAAEAGQRARASLMDGFDAAWEAYQQAWQGWQQSLLRLDDTEPEKQNIYRTSTAVLRTHEAKRFPGGMIASLSIPWGTAKGDDDLGGYHLVWPRDLVETAGGLLAAGASTEAPAGSSLSTSDARSRWPLGAKHVVGWHSVLEWYSA